jgi:hypothetical protein
LESGFPETTFRKTNTAKGKTLSWKLNQIFLWLESVFCWPESVFRWPESILRWLESVLRWPESVFRWPTFLIANKHRKVWKVVSRKVNSGKQTWPYFFTKFWVTCQSFKPYRIRFLNWILEKFQFNPYFSNFSINILNWSWNFSIFAIAHWKPWFKSFSLSTFYNLIPGFQIMQFEPYQPSNFQFLSNWPLILLISTPELMHLLHFDPWFWNYSIWPSINL